jgi:hypothetical protein
VFSVSLDYSGGLENLVNCNQTATLRLGKMTLILNSVAVSMLA